MALKKIKKRTASKPKVRNEIVLSTGATTPKATVYKSHDGYRVSTGKKVSPDRVEYTSRPIGSAARSNSSKPKTATASKKKIASKPKVRNEIVLSTGATTPKATVYKSHDGYRVSTGKKVSPDRVEYTSRPIGAAARTNKKTKK